MTIAVIAVVIIIYSGITNKNVDTKSFLTGVGLGATKAKYFIILRSNAPGHNFNFNFICCNH